MEKETIQNVVFTKEYYDRGLDLDLLQIVYFEDGEFREKEIYYGVELKYAPDEIIQKYKKLVEENNKIMEKYDKFLKIFDEHKCLVCGNRIFKVNAKWVKYFLGWDKDIYWCKVCNITYVKSFKWGILHIHLVRYEDKQFKHLLTFTRSYDWKVPPHRYVERNASIQVDDYSLLNALKSKYPVIEKIPIIK